MMQDNLAEKALAELFPEKHGKYLLKLEYTGRVKDYGGYVSISGGVLHFKLSRQWYKISPEIQMGLMQELMQKLFKSRGKHTMYVDLYNGFVRNLHLAIPKDENDPELEECFNRVNERYFLGLVERPNLRWGKFATTTFGSYDFKTDRITISSVFKEVEDNKYIDYIMFHEMLHKQRKFFKSGTKTYYHDKRFKRLENVFEGGNMIEKELGSVVRRAKASVAYRMKKEKKEEKKGWRGWFG
ncbi:SprT-like domain-containing protein [Candidatus Woesearchaeota archaeon]|nr:SprT-like domain-containing protein [Candidatus Woesearchaeota archaeon]